MPKSTKTHKDPPSTNLIKLDRLHTNRVEPKAKPVVKTPDQRAVLYNYPPLRKFHTLNLS